MSGASEPEIDGQGSGSIVKTVLIAVVIVIALLGGAAFFLARGPGLPFDYEGR